ncbi:unnamed protein product [Fusarium graminearum]|uniref:Chromosome 4, complete genome n=2 Tax=Gibberella zeae TaxID=5518 RepID=I1RZ53_GIBZE|nr:hypothetical protein FGSG_09679 [Fusarium graminearum PH-1]EYB24476.1 hypothetical protein FG05_09679 [Fusarium graminearum]ESU16290.1 hypothetical protein FGSG_09679 [Fusarium graminearum PH-1]PCD17907.1 hypothetical protein FGRA07_07375 [Fusarium graminearum]CAF3519526.1 unnamed protein product [Fusarium graminearum]CAF3535543.1 unnamed protein product [Fusarium graminearum]|eukprot:XP_011328026.1 hypothetical protein FGSG_09679 [Fusarium graminearum PH-1]
MSSPLKRMFSMKKDTAPSGPLEEPAAKSSDCKKEKKILELKLEITELKREIKVLSGCRDDAINAEHTVAEQWSRLTSALEVLQDLDKQLGSTYDRKGIEKAIMDATTKQDVLGYKRHEALKKVNQAEQEIAGCRDTIERHASTLKAYIKSRVD